uniref:Reverse transcriptase domain-containing protein n=1 Tax=Tanacetum cinerariifolium TaxID=118510 RepID=A0A699HBX6_TANCI|nr:hypothetical protein [Tanacetum cinerariifolium]
MCRCGGDGALAGDEKNGSGEMVFGIGIDYWVGRCLVWIRRIHENGYGVLEASEDDDGILDKLSLELSDREVKVKKVMRGYSIGVEALVDIRQVIKVDAELESRLNLMCLNGLLMKVITLITLFRPKPSKPDTSRNHHAPEIENSGLAHCFIFPVSFMSFGTSPPASGGSPHLSDQGPGVAGYRHTRRVGRLASSRRIWVGSWNIRTLTGKFFELVDALRMKNVDIACFQETKWKGSRTREGNQYKLWISDRIMLVRLVIENEMINVISAYAPKQLIIAGDLHDHIRANADGFSSVHGGFGEAAKETLGVVAGTLRMRIGRMESWWISDEVQDKVKVKQTRFKELISMRGEDEAYKSAAEERNKAVGPDEISIEAWRCLGGEGEQGLTTIFNKTFLRAKIPEEWRLGEERVIERRLRRETEVSENQFGFMLGRSTMEAIHIIRSLMEKYKERQKDLHLAFLDLEKAYDSVPQELIWKTLSDKGTPTRYINVVQDMGKDLYELTKGIQGSIPWCLIFADDIVLVSETPQGLNGRLEQWRKALEDKGIRVSREKTKYLRCNFNRSESDMNGEEEIRIGEHILESNESFRYLGSVMHKYGRIEDDVTHRIQVGWVSIRPAMMYGSECWSLTKVQANRMKVAEMRMLRWTCGKTIFDMIPNGVVRTNLQVVIIVNKMREGQPRWFGHIKRRPQSAPVRRVESLTVDGTRRRGGPKLRWEDKLKTNLNEMLLSEDTTSDRNAWRTRIRVDEGAIFCFFSFFAALCSLLCSSVALLYRLFRPFPLLVPCCISPFVPVVLPYNAI